MNVSTTVNGQLQSHDVEPRTLLVHYIRENCELTGTNVGCDTSSCGACTIHLDGEAVKSCTILAVQADGGVIGKRSSVGKPSITRDSAYLTGPGEASENSAK